MHTCNIMVFLYGNSISIWQILHKAAFKVVSQTQTNDDEAEDDEKQEAKPPPPVPDPVIVSSSNLIGFIGHIPFIFYRLYETTPPGVVMGLAGRQWEVE
uniref:Uncharacterized protein n=1 Tax=Amphimedon queenslandica TaxID=400682 RepID=A0A1X7T074_AMPQE